VLLHVGNVLLLLGLVGQVGLVGQAGRVSPVGRVGSADRVRPEGGPVAPGPGDRIGWLAFAVAALWAVHPLATEAVTGIAGRADLLMASGVLFALYAHVRASVLPGSIGWRIAEIGGATLAIFSKESGLAVVPVVILYDLLVGARTYARSSSGVHAVRKQAGVWVLLLVPALLFLYQRSIVAPSALAPIPYVDNPIAEAGFWVGRLTALAVVGRLLSLAFWPKALSIDYSYAQIPLASGTPTDVAAWLTVAAAVAFVIWLLFRGFRHPVFAAAFAFVTLLPAVNLLVPTRTLLAERVLYLPLAGLVACVVALTWGALERLPNGPARSTHRVAASLLAVIVAALGARTWDRNRDWRDEVSLWTSAVRAAPNSFKVHDRLAEALYQAGSSGDRLTDVISAADRAVAILDTLPDERKVIEPYRRNAGFHLELADRLMKEGAHRAAEADGAYQRAAELTQRTLAIAKAAPPAAAAALGSAAVPASNEAGEAQRRLAIIYLRLRDPERASDAARDARALMPFDTLSYRVSSAALVSSKRLDEAATVLLTGFMLTGDGELRQAVIDLYESDPGPKNCALKKGRDGIVVDPNCPMAQEHLCAASARAAAIQRESGRPELADKLHGDALQRYGCQIR
jgi:hypothetical protein